MLQLRGHLRGVKRSLSRVASDLAQLNLSKPLQVHGEWHDEKDEGGLSLSPPSLSHLLSPCRGTCQGRVLRY